MRKLILLIVAIIGMSAMAQSQQAPVLSGNEPNTSLSPAQWEHGIAICAQYEAKNAGFAAPDSLLPRAYKLNDLNRIYESQPGEAWSNIYDQLKNEEVPSGDMKRLRLVARKVGVPEHVVDEQMQIFLADNPEESTSYDIAAENVPDETATPVQQASGSGSKQWLFNVGMLLLALCAMMLALLSWREVGRVRKVLQAEIDNLKSGVNRNSTNVETVMTELRQRVNDISKQQQRPSAQQVVSNPLKTERQPVKLYLSKPDENGRFVSASATFEPGNSIYILDSPDGLKGTFEVIDDKEVHNLAMMMPTENLTRACTGKDIQVSGGMNRIVTDEPGTAVLDKGSWRVTRQAHIHYEA
ncbi:MAG: hypothetical protein IK092_04500 [Muribaculaceae bacterium]|nr:hypothetical protein [Muribaculaceae bacterium]